MNKVLHAVILAAFAGGCWFLSMMLKLPLMVAQAQTHSLPAFTRLCIGVGPLALGGLAILAVAYCLFVWTRKTQGSATWVGFLATTMSALVLVVLPTVVALYLPLVDFVNRSTGH